MKDEELDMLIANAEYEPQQLKDYIINLQVELNNQIEIANNRYVEITKLQEENEIVHKDFNELSEKYFFTKSRNKKAAECIKDFLCSEEYIKLDGKAIADNYVELMKILGGSDE